MALYPFVTLDAVPTGSSTIAAGNAVVIPLDLAGGQRLNIDVTHMDAPVGGSKQDYALRCWISQTPLGMPDMSLPLWIQTWQPQKPRNVIIISFHDSEVPGDQRYDIPASPGSYFLNILNLTNEDNAFSLTILDTTATQSA